MSVGNSIALVAALITAVGLVLSQLTYVRAVSSRAIVDMRVGQELAFHYTRDHRLNIRADLAFLNSGAQPAALVQVSATLLTGDPNTPEIQLRWRTFEDTTNSQGQGWVTGSTGTVRTLIIPGRAAGTSSITSRVRFVAFPGEPDGSLPVLGPEAHLTFTALVDYARTTPRPYSCRLQISPEHAAALNTKCVEHRNERGRYVFDARLFLLREITPPLNIASASSRQEETIETFTSWGTALHFAP